MAKANFVPAKEGHLDGTLDWDTATQKMALVRGYTFNAAHKFVSELTSAGGTLVASVTLAGKTVTAGVARCTSPVAFGSVASGAAITSVVVYQSSAAAGGADVAASAQRLIAYWDGTDAGLPQTPVGTAISVAVDSGANGLYAI